MYVLVLHTYVDVIYVFPLKRIFEYQKLHSNILNYKYSSNIRLSPIKHCDYSKDFVTARVNNRLLVTVSGLNFFGCLEVFPLMISYIQYHRNFL